MFAQTSSFHQTGFVGANLVFAAFRPRKPGEHKVRPYIVDKRPARPEK